MPTRVCSVCEEEKDIKDFHRANTKKVGVVSVCKECWSEQVKHKRKLRQDLIVELNGARCADCDMEHDNYSFFEWHHIDPKEKLATVSSLLAGASMERIVAEVLKCVLLCPNCHTNRHLKGEL